MPIILIANPKGGAGKTTTATNLAGFYASRGHRTMLGDLDRQQSADAWLKIRPTSAPLIEAWDRRDKRIARPPAGVTHVVLDTPAGLRGGDLKDVLKLADRVIVPLQPSIFDIFATQAFLAKLAERGTLSESGKLGVLGMRVDGRTRAADELHRFVEGLGLPVVGYLRATQNYVHLAAQGLTLWDVAPGRVAQDLDQWVPLLKWLDN